MTNHDAQPKRSARKRRPQVVLDVVATERKDRLFQRITLGGPGFVNVVDKPATDKYIKLLLPPDPSMGLQPPFNMDDLRQQLPKDKLPVRRTYTAHSIDPDSQTLVVDFLLHGDAGVAGPWAASAEVGDKVQFGGPGGMYFPDATADWHLLAGDEAAIPAIATALETMDDDAVGVAYLEVPGPEDEWELTAPDGIDVVWLHRGGAFTPDTTLLTDAIRSTEWRPGRVHGFIHGEREEMKALRTVLVDERGVDRKDLSLSAYWAYGRAEDAFQAEKQLPIGKIFDEGT